MATRVRHRPGAGQRERRRDRDRTSHRCNGGASGDDSAPRARTPGCDLRTRDDVLWRRPRYGHSARAGMSDPVLSSDGRAVVLAADHRARGIITIERYADYVAALRAALPSCDAVMATAQPLADLKRDGVAPGQATLLSINRTGLAGTAFELDDRLVATVGRAARDGYTGVKVMTRVDRSDPGGAAQLEMLGHVLEETHAAGLSCLVEPLTWTDGAMDRTPDGIIWAAVIAHDMGAPLLKVPVPDVAAGSARVDAVARIVDSVGVPVLFLGGPRMRDRDDVLAEVANVMAGGAAGMAIGRAVYQDPDPAQMAKDIVTLVHPD